MEATILIDQFFTSVLERLDRKYLEDPFPTKYETFRAINIYYLDDYYKIYRRKPNSLLLSNKLLDSFDEVISNSIRLLRTENYPKDRILLIYAYLTAYILKNSNIDLKKLENSLIEFKKINKKALVASYTKGYFKLDMVSANFLDELVREIIKYPGANEYYENANYHKYHMLAFFKASSSKFKGLLLKTFNLITKKSFTYEKEGLDNFLEIYNDLANKASNLIDAYNNYLYFKKEKQIKELIDSYKEKQREI